MQRGNSKHYHGIWIFGVQMVQKQLSYCVHQISLRYWINSTQVESGDNRIITTIRILINEEQFTLFYNIVKRTKSSEAIEEQLGSLGFKK